MSVLDAAMNWLAQFYTTRRREKGDWVMASRLVADDLGRAALDLQQVVESGLVPSTMDDSFLVAFAWEEYRPVFARAIPNNQEGDTFWFGMSELFDSLRKTHMLLRLQEPGAPLDPAFVDNVLRTGVEALRAAHDNLVGEPPRALSAA